MAEFSIDQNKLPGVKEVVRDFAVLEDHCLAHNLQEQEIESHLASNVHKSRLVQQDVALAKQLQEEEDRRAKAKAHRQHRDIERSDNEIAQEIQEELVRQAKQQRMQEEKDAAIARKLQEKERKEERKRQKQLEANFEEEYYEDNAIVSPLNPASRASLDLDDKPRWPGSNSLSLERDAVETRTNSLSRYPEHHLEGREGRRGRHGDAHPEHHRSSSRGKHGDRYPDYHHPTEGRSRGKEGQRSRDNQGSQSTFFADNHEPRRQRDEEGDRVVRRKERPARPPPPSHIPVKRDEASSRARHREWERDGERDRQREPRRDEEIERDAQRQERHGERLRDQEHSRDKDGHRERTKSREQGLDEVQDEPIPSCRSRAWDSGGEESPSPGDDEEGKGGARARLMLLSGPSELCEEAARRSPRMGRGERGHRDPGEGPSTGKECSHTHPAPREPGRIVQGGPGGRGAGNYGLGEVTQGITKLDLREQELLDMEVARKLQEEEVKASKMDKRAAQVAQDEEIATLYWCCQEIARLLMEREKMEYKKSREKEKQGMRPEERRRPEGGDYKPSSEELFHPRLREEEYQKPRNHQKPARPSQPPPHNYENVESSYSGSHYSSGSPARPEASYKGVYYRQ
ncbi:zinc finger CCCH domain-containing protein 13-like isoform X1 [Oncorhynchus keta]|uniref:zinc finger CCCH domain-containing protein 13-like isoform X1 n=1 Tax=Oncorhynchus keta TaxID=8018 RepID=UPI00227AFFBC|nr:zinc finger CCCH domain-containing protein 13-like isoform X1 [Oncorhynchus keta]